MILTGMPHARLWSGIFLLTRLFVFPGIGDTRQVGPKTPGLERHAGLDRNEGIAFVGQAAAREKIEQAGVLGRRVAAHRFRFRHDGHQTVQHFRRIATGTAVAAQQEVEIRMDAQLEVRAAAQARQQRGVVRDEPGHWYAVFLDEIDRVCQHIVMRPVNVDGQIRCARPVHLGANLDAGKSSACHDQISSRVTMLP